MALKDDVRKAQAAPTGILVPLVERFMTECAVEIESEEDLKFLNDLQRLTMRREQARQENMRYYSPSSLGEKCVRKAYLSRHAIRNEDAPSPYGLKAHYYFLTGNFIHLKWQFVLHKMEKWIGNSAIFHVHGYEIAVSSKRGDHRGTIDVVASIHGEPFVLDLKGLNIFSAKKISYGNIPIHYRIQVADYIILWNSQRNAPFRIKRGLLVVEDKSGSGKGILQEAIILLANDGDRAKRRIQKLREYEARGEMPPPLCKSLKDKTFQGCQFRTICWDEVEQAHKAHTRNMRALMSEAENEPTTAERVTQILRRKK
jgi:hypothetical protein